MRELTAFGRRSLRAMLVASMATTIASIAVGCGEGRATSDRSAPVAQTAQDLVGSEGAVTITTADTVVNRYSALTVDAAAGAKSITVGAIATLAPVAGDLLMVIQMQGATIDTTSTATYGNVTATNSAGLYELVTVSSVTGAVISLNASCGLKNAYSAKGHTQVVWVPQYSSLTVSGAGSIVAPAWNGSTGGVVAIQSLTTSLQTPGAINVAGLGFRGGVVKQLTTLPLTGAPAIVSTNIDVGSEKGEGIAGYHAEYDKLNGRYGIGAPANGGGGGGPHNSGGGGGSNGNNGQPYTGAGVMTSATGAASWAIDPEGAAAGGLTNSAGGGRGGYSYASMVQDPTTVPPGDPSWSGDDRQQHGGRGGYPLTANPASQIFLGGGGGAGESNDSTGTSGAAGGGIVLVLSNSIDGAGTGSIVADGATPASVLATGSGDGAGGGGGGGTIVLLSSTVTNLALSANGGIGGSQNISSAESEGPGGGGGAGVVASTAAVTASVAGGAGGTTNSSVAAGFIANGATSGASTAAAVLLASGTTGPVCIPADVAVTVTSSPMGDLAPGQMVTYTVTVTNNGPNPVTGATVTDNLPGQVTNVTWTCTGTACPAPSGSGDINAVLGTLPANGTATFTVTGTVASGATSGTLSNTGTVADPPGLTDPNPGNNSSTANNPLVCSLDAQCAAGSWCDDLGTPGVGSCQLQTVNGQPVPGGACNPTIGGRACVAGVCDPNGEVCGINLGDGTCTTTSQCNQGVCIASGNDKGDCEGCATDADCSGATPACDTTTNGCVQCTPSNASACSGTTPACSASEACVPCNGDNGTSGTADCPTTGDPWCSTTGACAKCTMDSDCTGGTATHGGMFCDTATGACGAKCSTDAECGAGNWCDDLGSPGSGTCQPKTPNTQPIPGGSCNATLGGRACVSGACDTTGNVCGIDLGDGTCATTTQCNAGVCVTTGTKGNTCELCGMDADCAAPTATCDTTTYTCVQCTSTSTSACMGNTPVCGATETCVACNGDNGTSGTADCSTTSPWCSPTGACGKCAMDADCTGGTATHGGMFCDPTTGACGTKCAMDADCPSGDWCDDLGTPGAGTCQAKTPNGQPVPGGSCSATIGGRACVSGVCDSDNACGYANGDGPCTTSNGTVVCRSMMCLTSGVCGVVTTGCNADSDCTGGDWCDESTHTCTAKLSNGVAVPSDPPHSNPTLNGTCTPAAGTLVCASGVCDTKDNACGLAPGDGTCTSNAQCRSGSCDTTTGICGGCATDSQCPSADWCDESMHACTPKLPNGAGVPTDPPHANPSLNGTCTAAAGALVCVSGVCDAKDNDCGYANGDGPCSSNAQCRSGSCDTTTGICGCTMDSQCPSADYCASTGSCTPKKPIADTCTANDQCQSDLCVAGVCSEVVATGYGACEAAPSNGSSSSDARGILGLLVAAAGLARRRRSR